jgi:hypothetical protein
MTTATTPKQDRRKYHIRKEDLYTKDVHITDLMEHSFHLPVDILTHPAWEILDPVILNPLDIPTKYIDEVYIDGNSFLFWNAKQVALSARVDKKTGVEYFVGRIWFGKEVK